MSDEYHIHMEDFHHGAHEEGVHGGGLFPLEQNDMHSGGHKAGKTGGNTAGNAGIASDSKVGSRDETLDTTNETGQDSG